jgi:hypothetical protein
MIAMLLEDLTLIPKSLKKRKQLLLDSTGVVLHEVGHVVSAALNGGIATDYLVFDWSATALRHSTYIDECYRDKLACNVPLQVRTAAGGIAAEKLIFGEGCLPRADQDFIKIAELLGQRFRADQMGALVNMVLQDFDPIIPSDAVDLVRDLYRRTVKAVQGRRYRVDSIDIIPFSAVGFSKNVSLADRVLANLRTRLGRNRDVIARSIRSPHLSSGL